MNKKHLICKKTSLFNLFIALVLYSGCASAPTTSTHEEIQEQGTKIAECYTTGINPDGSRTGQDFLRVRFEVGTTDQPHDLAVIESSVQSARVETCVLNVIAATHFPRTNDQNRGTLERTFIFNQADGSLIFQGSINRNAIDLGIRQHQDTLLQCYQKEVQGSPTLSGKILSSFIIGKDGHVSDASIRSTTLKNSNVENCVLSVIRSIQFPIPSDGIPASVTYPFNFSAQTGADHSSKQAQLPEDAKIDAAQVELALMAHQPQFIACYEAEAKHKPKLSGKIVIDFLIGNREFAHHAKVESSTMKNAQVESCLKKEILKIKFPTTEDKKPFHVRYPFNFSLN